MKTIDFQDWTIITGYDVKRQAKRNIFQTIHPNLYDAMLLVYKAADQPPSVKLSGYIHCYGCGEEFPFTRDILLFGSGGITLDCKHCASQMEICHWSIQTLKGLLAAFLPHLKIANWITITPYSYSKESPLGTLNFKISEIGGIKSLS